MEWSDHEENNDNLTQPNRDLPESESSEEDNDYYNIIYKTQSTSILDYNKEDSIKKPKPKPKPKNNKTKYTTIVLTETKQINNRKLNPRLPPPNKK